MPLHPDTGGQDPERRERPHPAQGTLHMSPLPHNWLITRLTGPPREQGRGVPAQHRDSAATSGTSTVLRELHLSGERGEPLSSRGLHAGGQ